MNISYIALGSNIEPRASFVAKAISLLEKNDVKVECKSSIYETAPVGYTKQSDFLNMVIYVTTKHTAESLLNVCQQIEARLGRERKLENGPRTIDLDILLYNDAIIETKRLIVPHPRMHERAFVLVPLNDVAKSNKIPKINKSVEQLMQELPEENLNEVHKWKENKEK